MSGVCRHPRWPKTDISIATLSRACTLIDSVRGPLKRLVETRVALEAT